jgi:hypothetical protein
LFSIVSLAAGGGLLYLGMLGNLLNIDLLNSLRAGVYSSGGSGLGILFDFSDPLSVLVYYPLSVVNVAFGPFPWQIKTSLHALSLLENIPWWIIFGFLAWHWRIIVRGWRQTLPSLFFSAGLFAAIGLVSDNAGANLRLRMAAVLVLVCLVPLILAQRKKSPA